MIIYLQALCIDMLYCSMMYYIVFIISYLLYCIIFCILFYGSKQKVHF